MPLPVYTYWTGPQPAWIGLCLETLQRHNPGLQLLDDTIWDQYDGLIPKTTIMLQAPNVRSDFLRAWLLSTRGGVWCDADCICFRDLAPLLDRLTAGPTGRAESDFLAYRKAAIMTALLACRPGSAIAADYYARMIAALRPGRRLTSMALGPHVLRAAVRTVPARLALIPTPLVHPLQGPRFGRCPTLWTPTDWQPEPDAYTCMLTHRALGPAARLSRDQLLRSKITIGCLFRQALGERGGVSPPVLNERGGVSPPVLNERSGVSPPVVIIGALSGDAHAARRQSCMNTWIPDVEALGCTVVFLRGDSAQTDQYNLALPCPDRRDTLSLKTQEFCRWALQRDDWDYLFKCDDDTMLHPQRFAAYVRSELAGDYTGGKWRPASTYASGGAGYFLSRRAAQVIAAAPLPPVYGEDRVVGATLTAAGITIRTDPRFNASEQRRSMRQHPRLITTHGVREQSSWFKLYDWIRQTETPAIGALSQER